MTPNEIVDAASRVTYEVVAGTVVVITGFLLKIRAGDKVQLRDIEAKISKLGEKHAVLAKESITYSEARQLVDDKLELLTLQQEQTLDLVRSMDINLASLLQITAINNTKIESVEGRLNRRNGDT